MKQRDRMTQTQHKEVDAQRRAFVERTLNDAGIPQRYGMNATEMFQALQDATVAIRQRLQGKPESSH